MTLDEAIKHSEEVAEENQRVADTRMLDDGWSVDAMYCDDTEAADEHITRCAECAAEHRQLAEWLKDYKRLLEQEQSYNSIKTELEPCDDTISRQAAINAAIEAADEWDGGGNRNREKIIEKALEQLPPVTPQPKMGHWIKTPKAVMGEGYMWYCDKCEHKVYQDSSKPYPSEKYCPNCGAKMQEVEE